MQSLVTDINTQEIIKEDQWKRKEEIQKHFQQYINISKVSKHIIFCSKLNLAKSYIIKTIKIFYKECNLLIIFLNN